MSVWVSLSEAAQILGVSVDTVKRRIVAGQFQARREQRPQGFRWVVELPAENAPHDEAGVVPIDEARPAADSPEDSAPVGVQDQALAIAVLRREIVRLEETVSLLSDELNRRHREFSALLAWLHGIGLHDMPAVAGHAADDGAVEAPPAPAERALPDPQRRWRAPWQRSENGTP